MVSFPDGDSFGCKLPMQKTQVVMVVHHLYQQGGCKRCLSLVVLLVLCCWLAGLLLVCCRLRVPLVAVFLYTASWYGNSRKERAKHALGPTGST